MSEKKGLNLNTLRKYNHIRDAEFKCCMDEDTVWTIVDRSNELAGEAGEVCNVAKKIRREDIGMLETDKTIHDLAEELADVVICADLLAMDMGVDLGEAIKEKFNKSSKKFGLLTEIK